ncbi:Rni-like superfamily protein [Thalictrum thalictroides]|uniref:Rni-like superfamily protein n=1 Tax=Thalictrum thalictroides TaxID=46969 RepID=A0A7J6WUH9_THATH|nr:Rni-like superfamily protein [Thalictrum thalictroides]
MLPLLEELDISHAHYRCDLFELISLSCPKLTHVRVEYPVGSWHSDPSEYDEHAFAIAKSMPHLHSLHLIRSSLTNKGLQAIREGFPNLEYLDVRSCFKLTLRGDVFKKCACGYRNIRISNEQTCRRSSIAITGAPIT